MRLILISTNFCFNPETVKSPPLTGKSDLESDRTSTGCVTIGWLEQRETHRYQ